jgi:hypothetical protein
VPEPVLEHLVEHAADNVRRLKAAAYQLVAVHEHLGLPLDLALARQVVPPGDGEGDRPFRADVAELVSARVFPAVTEGPRPQVRPSPNPTSPQARLKEMLTSADSKDEQIRALQIALGERLRQLRVEGSNPTLAEQLERALDLLREGRFQEALTCIQ